MNQLVRLVRSVRIITPKTVPNTFKMYFFSLFYSAESTCGILVAFANVAGPSPSH